jgi:uncharacterized SAM-binding protein YcdF (DUF218 family)
VTGRRAGTWRWRWATLALVTAAAVVVGAVVVRHVGFWLVVSDPLAPARAIVVMTGDFPFRAMEAAAIYREGWAPEVWLPQSSAPAREAALRRLGFAVTREEESTRRLLERLGVPPGSIRVLTGAARNTREEIDLVRGELARIGGRAVVLVTSKAHTRRVRATWRALGGGTARAVVRYAREDPFEPGGWWRNTSDALAVSRELLGVINVWLGFPLSPAGG